jgi:hypothetical protein
MSSTFNLQYGGRLLPHSSVAFDLESGRIDGVFYRYGLYVLLKPLRVFVTMNEPSG